LPLLLLLCGDQVCEERIAELSVRLASQESKVGQLKAERQELYQKLAAASEATRNQVRSKRRRGFLRSGAVRLAAAVCLLCTLLFHLQRASIYSSACMMAMQDWHYCYQCVMQDESRLEREIARLQAAAASDLERIRKEAAETGEREARLLRWVRRLPSSFLATTRILMYSLGGNVVGFCAYSAVATT
jgi:uncharacterized coiled-coil protein SlyX